MAFESQGNNGDEANDIGGFEVPGGKIWLSPDGRQNVNLFTKWARKLIRYMNGKKDDPDDGGHYIDGESAGSDGGRGNLAARIWAKIGGLPQRFWASMEPKKIFSNSIDRLNFIVLPLVLLVALVLIMVFGFVKPVQCLALEKMDVEMFNFTLKTCQARNFYTAIPDIGVPWTREEPRRHVVAYSYWLPPIMLLQSMLFSVPYWFWTGLIDSNGKDFAKIIRCLAKFRIGQQNEIERKFLRLADMIRLATKYRERHLFGRAYNCILYITFKCLCLANVVGHFILWNMVFGGGNGLWGFEVLYGLFSGEIWKWQSLFPQQAICEVDLYQPSGFEHYELYCHLPINDVVALICVLFWLLFLGIACVTALNIVYHQLSMFWPNVRQNTVKKYVREHVARIERLDGQNDMQRKCLMNCFAKTGLDYDGVLLFRFIADHAGQQVASHLMAALFEDFLAENEALLNQDADGVPSGGETDDE